MKLNKLAFALIAVSALTSCGSTDSGMLGKEVIKLDSQLDTLTQLKSGSIDVSIIDSVMAGYYTSKGDYADDLMVVDNLVLATEQYGIAGRKEDLTFMDKINEALFGTYKNNELGKIAEYFGVTSSVAINGSSSYTKTTSTDSSWDDIVKSGKIIVGYTVFAPIAYTDKDNYSGNEFTGFDVELARACVSYLNTTYSTNLQLEFLEIDWDAKEALLSGGTIDLIWNGLTITEERLANMAISVPYMNNNQVAVIRKEDKNTYTTKESLKNAVIGVESGSAGEDVALGK